MSDHADQIILTGMARALWVWAWSVWGLDEGPAYLPTGEVTSSSRIVPFKDWDDVDTMLMHGYDRAVPVTPPQAFRVARDLAHAYASVQNNADLGKQPALSTLLEIAQMADGDHAEYADDVALVFGERLATMAIGEPHRRGPHGTLGVAAVPVMGSDDASRLVIMPSWFDNHATFELAIPHVKVVFRPRADPPPGTIFNGYVLVWDIDGALRLSGTVPTSPFGDNFRIENQQIEDGRVIDETELPDFLEHVGDRDQGNDADVVIDHLMEQWSRGEPFFEVAMPSVYERVSSDGEIWRSTVYGITKDLITQIDQTIEDTAHDRARAFAAGGGQKFDRRWGKLLYVNPGNRTYDRHMFILWFGHFTTERYVIYANSLEDALDEGIDYIAEESPGLLANTAVQEEYERLRVEWEKTHGRDYDPEGNDYVLETEAEEDTTSGGNAGDRIASDEWGIVAEDPSDDELREIADRR